MHTSVAKFISGKMKNELKSGKHTYYSDVSIEDGGEDLGPDPHDLLSMSLASCTAMTIRMYAQRKKWPLENAVVTVDVDDSIVGHVLKRKIELIGALDDDQKKRLLEMADKCPIHKLLIGKIEIQTNVT